MTYKEAEYTFSKCRDKQKGSLLAKHTRLQKRGRAFFVKYHKTDVVIIRPDGKYRINSGGWRTRTTQNRINSILPVPSLHVKAKVWLFGNQEYQDRMLIDAKGVPVK